MSKYYSYSDYRPKDVEIFDALADRVGGASKLFDLVAPIAIFHFADLRLAKQARTAAKKLKAELSKTSFHGSAEEARLLLVESKEPCFDDAVSTIRDLYRAGYSRAFEEACASRGKDALFTIDKYAAFGYIVEDEGIFGDDCGMFPYYMEASLIDERVADVGTQLEFN